MWQEQPRHATEHRQTRTSVPQAVDVGADLEGGTELDVHGGHEVLLLQQEQSLSVDLLGQELGGNLLTTFKKKEKRKRDSRKSER